MTNAMKHTFLCYQSLDKLLREKLDQMFCSFLFGCLFYYWFVRVLWEQFFWKQEQSFVAWVVFDSTFRNLNIRFSRKSVTRVLTNLSREVSLSVGKCSLKLSCYKAFSRSVSLFFLQFTSCQFAKWARHGHPTGGWNEEDSGLADGGEGHSGATKEDVKSCGGTGATELLGWGTIREVRAAEASWVRWAGAWRIGVSPAKRNAFA